MRWQVASERWQAGKRQWIVAKENLKYTASGAPIKMAHSSAAIVCVCVRVYIYYVYVCVSKCENAFWLPFSLITPASG